MGRLGDLALEAGRGSTAGRDVVDIITFAEAPWGLQMRLYPAQRVILKAYYGVALDNNPNRYPLDTPVEPSHPAYDPTLLDVDGYYKYRVALSTWRRDNPTYVTEEQYLALLYDQGRCNIRTVRVGHERREMVLSLGRRSGKCVTGDTLVLTDHGVVRIDSLGDLHGEEHQPLSVVVAQEGRGTRATASAFYQGGLRTVRVVRTHCGYGVSGTDGHRVKVLDSDGHIRWKYLADMRVGDVVAVHRGTDLWSASEVDVRHLHNEQGREEFQFPDMVNERWGLMLGLLVGDGNWKERHSVRFCAADPEMWSIARSLFNEVFGNHAVTMDPRTENTGEIRCCGVRLRQFLHDLGWSWDVDSYNKMVPWSIMCSKEPVVRAFLRGLFETDGGMEKSKTVSFCSASLRLVREVQVLLLNLGVVTRIRAKWNAKHQRDYYILYVRGLRSRRVFMEKVGFLSDRKGDVLRAGVGRASKEGGDTESIPHLRGSLQELLRSVPVERGDSRSLLRTACGNIIKSSSYESVTYARLARVLPAARAANADPVIIDHLQHIYDLDYFYDKVVSVDEEEAPVYDLVVPDRVMFVANGLTNHNTEMSSCIAAYETYRLLAKGDPQSYYGIPPSENIQLVSFATDKDQAGILYQKVSGYFRGCFASETEIITDQGVKPIGSLVGTSPTILTRNGTWMPAPIRSFGVQPLLKLTLQRQGIEKVIYTTANHRWFARDARKAHRGQGFQEFTTTELRPDKHRLQATFGKSYKGRIDPSSFGVAHGFVFGDGTTAGGRNATVAHLYGEKGATLFPYFAMCPRRRGDVRAEQSNSERTECSVEVAALPNFFCDLPSIAENKAYLLGWAMGYFAADGCLSSSDVEVVSVKRKNIEFFRDVCVLLGVGTYDIRQEDKVSNITGKPFTLFKLKLMRGSLDESFFVLPSHREAFRALCGDDVHRKVLAWTVKSVEPTDRVEEVYCATVEGHGDFVLAGNIATGNCAFFEPYTANNTQTYARFQTPRDIERYGSYHEDPTAKATIRVTFKSSVAKGSRGPGNIVVILDEMAHFTDNGQSSADEVYKAVVPSTTTFVRKDPRDKNKPLAGARLESKIIAISSPLGRQGMFYDLFSEGFRSTEISDSRLCFQAPTWEVNPTLPVEAFAAEYVKDPRTFDTEFGARFTDRTRGWIEDAADLLACIDPNARPKSKAPPKVPHVMGVDVGLVDDASAVAIGHPDEQGRVVADLVDYIKADEGIYAGKLRLEFTEVASWIHDYTRRFYISEGEFDQYLGIPMEQALAAKGLKQFEAVHYTPQLRSQMFQNFKSLMYDRRLVLYDWPIPPGKTHSLLIEQLLELQAEYKSQYVTIVKAPKVKGKHDDLADAFVRMVWLASKDLGKPLAIAGVRSFGSAKRPGPQTVMAQRSLTTAMLRAHKKAFQSGSSPERMVPKKLGFGHKGVSGIPKKPGGRGFGRGGM